MPHTSPAAADRAPHAPHLTERQRQCLALAAQGLNSRQIGDRLGLSPRTIDEHLMGACAALGVRSRVEAVARLASSARVSSEQRTFAP